MPESPFSIENKSGRASIKIIGAIDWWDNDSKSFTRMVDELIKQGITDVDGYINSPGGQMFEGNEIANQIRRFTGERDVVLGALVASSATTVSLAFKNITASKNTQYMVHDPFMFAKIEHLEDWESKKKMYENLRNQAISEYAEKTGIKKKEISEMMRNTTWLNATDARSKGFIDDVLDTNATLPENAFQDLQNMRFEVPEAVKVQMQITNQNNEKSDMKKVLSHLGLPENATEDQVIEAINKKDEIAQNAITNYGKSKGMKEDDVKELAKSAPSATLKMIDGMTSAPSNSNPPAGDPPSGDPPAGDPPTGADALNNKIVNLLEQNLKGGGGSDPSNKTWDDYTPEEREELSNSNEAEFDKLYNAKYKK